MNHSILKAVLFDMDGVLYNSMPNHAIAWTRSMAEFGLKMTKADAYATEGARGIDTIRHLVRVQQHKEITLDEAQAMYDLKTKYFHELPTAPVFAGVTDLMDKIVKAGMTVNVVTGSGQRPLINRLLDDFGKWLDPKHITTAYDVERGKPAPDPYLAGLRKAGSLKPSEAIVVENAPLGVRSGVAAGIFTVAINSGPLPDEALLCEGADALYPSIADFCNDFEALLSRAEARSKQ
jgi:HAD superfamily hydrolase (TIGR01509 family)